MIPIRDSEAWRRLTLTNTLLILANLAVFGWQLQVEGESGFTFVQYAMVPARITHLGARVYAGDAHPLGAWALDTLLTSLFLHADWLHIAGNMLYLFIFGAAVEERMGHLRYLCFYLAAGIAAGLAMVAMGPESRVPVIGASGAIAGVLGAYFVLYPGGRILTLVPFFLIPQLVQIPAILYLLVWFAIQLYSGLVAGARGPLVGGVAWWAHVGGFLFGLALAPVLARASTGRGGRA
jgi:rhomboid family protein